MSKALIVVIIAVIAVAAIGAAVVIANNGDDKGKDTEGNSSELYFVGSMSTYAINVYLGQKGSSEMTLLDGGGTFQIPSTDAIIIVKAVNPTGAISVEGNKILIPMTDGTVKANIGFDKADIADPVIMDSVTTYYAFTPKADRVNLGVFTNS